MKVFVYCTIPFLSMGYFKLIIRPHIYLGVNVPAISNKLIIQLPTKVSYDNSPFSGIPFVNLIT